MAILPTKFRTANLEEQVVLRAALRWQIEEHERGEVVLTDDFLNRARKLHQSLDELVSRRKRNIDAKVTKLLERKAASSE